MQSWRLAYGHDVDDSEIEKAEATAVDAGTKRLSIVCDVAARLYTVDLRS